jgi:two-component system sensor histidine kinase KdpD
MEGMGLGLSIARSIIEAHEGRIWAENGPDGGAAFRILLPPAALLSEGSPPV